MNVGRAIILQCPICTMLRRTPVRCVGGATRGRSGDHARRNTEQGRRAMGAAAERGREDSVQSNGRRACSIEKQCERVFVQRSHAPLGNTDHTSPVAGDDGGPSRARHVLRVCFAFATFRYFTGAIGV